MGKVHQIDPIEFRKTIEDGHANVSRAKTSIDRPSKFMLLAAMNPCSCVAILPIALSAPKPTGIPQVLKTYGDHVRKRRLELRLSQLEVARLLGVNECTVNNWERWRTEPTLRVLPGIIDFLGYRPDLDSAGTLGERMKAYRRTKGFSRKALARQLGIDPDTLGKWERNESEPEGRLKGRFDSYFGALGLDSVEQKK